MNYDNCTANRQFDRTNMDVVLGIQQRNWKYKLKRCFTTTTKKMQTPSSTKQTALTLKHQKWFSRRFPLTARDLRKTAKNNKLWLRSKPNRRDECWVYFSLAERQGENRQSLICKLVSLAVNINFRIKFFGFFWGKERIPWYRQKSPDEKVSSTFGGALRLITDVALSRTVLIRNFKGTRWTSCDEAEINFTLKASGCRDILAWCFTLLASNDSNLGVESYSLNIIYRNQTVFSWRPWDDSSLRAIVEQKRIFQTFLAFTILSRQCLSPLAFSLQSHRLNKHRLK